MGSKSYYKYINIIRVFFCLAVLLYHFGFLKGGYLAVCSFFVLSGYLSSVTNFEKEKFSFKSYYYSKLVKIYMPLFVLVFSTIAIYSFFPDIKWLNLKQETISVLLNYNNFWQISANLDYFAGDINSPFIHLWYISILLQFDLIFPFLFLFFKKIGEKVNKGLSLILIFIMLIISTVYFYIVSISGNMMLSYYNTFARVFSLLFGIFLGFFHCYYGKFLSNSFEKSKINIFLLMLYFFILMLFYIFVGADNNYYGIAMIFVTLLTCFLISYSNGVVVSNDMSFNDRVFKYFSERSYEIYLVQYPVIFFMQYLNLNSYLKFIITLILILLFSCLLDYSLDLKRKGRNKFILCFFRIILFGVVCFGIYYYFVSKDYKKEMELLEKQLEENEILMNKRQEDFNSNVKNDDSWLLEIEDLNSEREKLNDYISNLPIVGIGDSVMLGAVTNLYSQFKNGYFDAKVSRTAYSLNGILVDLKNKNMLNGPIVVNLGTNGDCGEKCRIEIMETCSDVDVFWVNVTNDHSVHFNDKIEEFASRYDNLYVVDWNSNSKGHLEYFGSDGIHLTTTGRIAYVKTIYDKIYQVYLEKFEQKKNEVLLKHEEELKRNISFYGNGVLLNTFDYIKDEFLDDKFNINKDYTYEVLKEDIKKEIDNNTLNYNILLVFDKTFEISIEEYIELITLGSNYNIYIVSLDEDFSKRIIKYNYDNVKLIDFYKEINESDKYIMIDNIHLTNEGNKALAEVIKNLFN